MPDTVGVVDRSRHLRDGFRSIRGNVLFHLRIPHSRKASTRRTVVSVLVAAFSSVGAGLGFDLLNVLVRQGATDFAADRLK